MKFSNGYEGIKPAHTHNDTIDIATKYTHINSTGTGLLAYRDLPKLIKKYVQGNKALDFGCGTGYSTRLLKNLNFDVIGVDISMNMLLQALNQKDGIPYAHIELGKVNSPNLTYDLVLSCFVHVDMPSLKIMIEAQTEIARVLKDNGILIVVTSSEELPKNDWQSVKKITSNELDTEKMYKTYIPHIDVTFHDYFYTDKDYQEVFKQTGFEIIETYYPFAHEEDELSFHIEKKISPQTIYICRKII